MFIRYSVVMVKILNGSIWNEYYSILLNSVHSKFIITFFFNGSYFVLSGSSLIQQMCFPGKSVISYRGAVVGARWE